MERWKPDMISILTATLTDINLESIIRSVTVTDHQPLSVEASLLKDRIHIASIIFTGLVSHTFVLITYMEFCLLQNDAKNDQMKENIGFQTKYERDIYLKG